MTSGKKFHRLITSDSTPPPLIIYDRSLRGINFLLEPTTQATVLTLLNKINPSKSTVINNLEGKFLKEGAPVLVSPITDLLNFSVELLSFSKNYKKAKLKPLYKMEAKTYRPFYLLLLM